MTNTFPALSKAHKYLSIAATSVNEFAVVLMIIMLTACSSTPQHSNQLKQPHPSISSITKSNSGFLGLSSNPTTRKGGGYYLDDGPSDNPPADLHLIPDAEPKAEPLRLANMKPYVALGKYFKPMTELGPYKKQGVASWYGRRYHGSNTASGEVYDMYAMTAAHPTLPLPSYVRVTNLENGKSIIVRLNDRGPFLSDRLIDLSYTAAYKLGILGGGSGHVEIESILPRDDSTQMAISKPSTTATTITDMNAEANMIYLQLGAFGSPDNAHNFLTQIRKKLPGLNDAVSIKKNNGLYKIHAGPYSDQILAKQAANMITQHLTVTPLLVID